MSDESYHAAMSALFNTAVFAVMACVLIVGVGRWAVHCWFLVRRAIVHGRESLDAQADREANRPEYPE